MSKLPRPSESEEIRPSRGMLRREQQARDEVLWKLANVLAALSPQARSRLPLDPSLNEEIALAATIGPSSGRRRQLRRVTQLLREGDAEGIQRALRPAPVSRAVARPADAWLERLASEGDAALQELTQEHPELDRTRVRQWLRSLSRERAARAASDGAQGKGKAESALRQYLQTQLGRQAIKP